MGLAELNSLLRGQLSQSGQVNEALREDLRKLTTDWSKAVEEAGQRELEWHKEKEVCLVAPPSFQATLIRRSSYLAG